jgi:hypothetical protein
MSTQIGLKDITYLRRKITPIYQDGKLSGIYINGMRDKCVKLKFFTSKAQEWLFERF